MEKKYFSLSPNPPIGFEHGIPDKIELAENTIAVFADDIECILDFVKDFDFPCKGLFITKGDAFSHSCINRELWHIVVPDSMSEDLYQTTLFYFDLMFDKQKSKSDKENSKYRREKIQLPEDESKYRNYIENASHGILIVDEKGNYIDINKAVENITGYSRDELLKMNMLELIPEEEQHKAEAHFKKLLSKGKAIEDLMFLKKDGNRCYCTIEAVKLSENKFLGIAKDITDQKRAEERLRKLFDNTQDAIIIHDMEQNIIDVNDRMCKMYGLSKDEALHIKINDISGPNMLIETAIENRKKTINGEKILFEWEAKRPKDDKVFNVEVSMQRLSFYDKDVVFSNIRDITDRKKAEQSLLDSEEYVRSIFRAAPTGIGVVVDRVLKHINQKICKMLKGKELEIYVKDTGVGISPEKQGIIFNRFSQADNILSDKVGGLGLGLSIAKENAELIGGKITLESEMEQGSVFYLTMPYNPVYEKTGNAGVNEIASENTKTYTILIAEDEEVNYLFIETLIHEEIALKCNIIHAKTGEEAVKMCELYDEIDIVLMDIKMPVMNGFEATVKIKRHRPELPVIAQTAYSIIKDKEKALQAGCDNFISKPIDLEILNDVLSTYLEY